MQKQFAILGLSIIIFFSCNKEVDTITVEGVVTDDASGEPISGVTIYADAIKSPSSMGILTDGKREPAGHATTDENGHFKMNLELFPGAESVDFDINGGYQLQNYVYEQKNIFLSDLKLNSNINFSLSPTAILNIKFKNVHPVSDSDYFYFGCFFNADGWTKGFLQKTYCGSVRPDEAFNFWGKDVCGTFSLDAPAERKTTVVWSTGKNGVVKEYVDSVFVKRNGITDFIINY